MGSINDKLTLQRLLITLLQAGPLVLCARQQVKARTTSRLSHSLVTLGLQANSTPLGQPLNPESVLGHPQDQHVHHSLGQLHSSGTLLLAPVATDHTWFNVNDPAAGSPTTTLLRLLLPLAAGHCPISTGTQKCPWPPDGSIQLPSVATTGGVYKWQGRNLCELMTHAY